MILIKEVVVLAVLYYWFIAVSSAEVIKMKACKKGREADAKSVVHEVSIKPCPNGSSICELYRGTNATVTVKFTPSTSPSSNSGCKIISKLAWVSKLEMNFGDISPNACNYMECPLEANTEAVFNATFYVSKMWPTGPYPLKLRVQEKKGPQRVLLCQVFQVMLTDQPADIVLN